MATTAAVQSTELLYVCHLCDVEYNRRNNLRKHFNDVENYNVKMENPGRPSQAERRFVCHGVYSQTGLITIGLICRE